jgi:hypothetical protein
MPAEAIHDATWRMRQTKVPLVLTILYVIGISIAIICNQRGVDPEGVIWGQIVLSLPWGLIPELLGVNAWYGPYVYCASIVLNAATVYAIAAWLIARRSRPSRSRPMS